MPASSATAAPKNRMDKIMYETPSARNEPVTIQGSGDPAHLASLIEAWEVAKVAYCEILKSGVNRSDVELARDISYRRLLRAGLCIHRLGGSDAVGVVAACLDRSLNQEGARHFDRLWNGLLPGRRH